MHDRVTDGGTAGRAQVCFTHVFLTLTAMQPDGWEHCTNSRHRASGASLTAFASDSPASHDPRTRLRGAALPVPLGPPLAGGSRGASRARPATPPSNKEQSLQR
jgi:hypothetical protein